MGRKTDGERIDDLQHKAAELDKADAVLTLRLSIVEQTAGEVKDAQRDVDKRLAELQRTTEAQFAAIRLDYEKQLAELRRSHEAETKLLKQQVEELKQEQLRWGARLWQVTIALVVVVVGTALTTYLGLKK